MGWKNIKERFKIGHIVRIDEGKLQIGSAYVPELASIDLKTGIAASNRTFSNFLKDEYPELANATPHDILILLHEKDEFKDSNKVYTYSGSEIIEEYCEEYGWPNCTHSGKVMYENVFFKNKKDAIAYAKRNNKADIEFYNSQIKEKEEEIKSLNQRLLKAIKEQKELSEHD